MKPLHREAYTETPMFLRERGIICDLWPFCAF